MSIVPTSFSGARCKGTDSVTGERCTREAVPGNCGFCEVCRSIVSERNPERCLFGVPKIYHSATSSSSQQVYYESDDVHASSSSRMGRKSPGVVPSADFTLGHVSKSCETISPSTFDRYGYPYDFLYFGPYRLGKLDEEELIRLCVERNIDIPQSFSKEDIIKRILHWKRGLWNTDVEKRMEGREKEKEEFEAWKLKEFGDVRCDGGDMGKDSSLDEDEGPVVPLAQLTLGQASKAFGLVEHEKIVSPSRFNPKKYPYNLRQFGQFRLQKLLN
eukprot:TRINITY_DN2939_c0_g1_i4.p1 TRINITY_DN2939_c0_g1~~TRINITY_DN2939_c0_g1_i4.p1  ORF type:complete len:273 (-),score=56.56 TRINITY_DN2939_c0_g1_i4:88-906(-)